MRMNEMMETVTAADLKKGDKLRDTEGHGRTNKFGPSVTDEIVVKSRWHGSNWLFGVVLGNGRVGPNAATTFAVPDAEIDERLASGRYETVDCEVNRSLNFDELPIGPDDEFYIRFGDVPEGERSTNHTDGSEESGVSVYGATVEGVLPDVDVPGMFLPYGHKLQQILFLARRDTYLVTGDEVGRGEDGEPVLKNVEVLCELELSSECNGFIPKR